LGERERYVAFAFAAADLLVEASLDGEIAFAAGAFRVRFGVPAESFQGQSVFALIAPGDRGSLQAALSLMPERGRLSPTVLRLGNTAMTPFVVSGLYLALPGEPPRICLSLGPLPIPLESQAPALPLAATLLRETEARLRAGPRPGEAPPQLGLIEVKGRIPDDMRAVIAAEAGGGTLAAELAPGRFGLLPASGDPSPDIVSVSRRIEAMLAQHAPGATVSGELLSLDAGNLSPVQAVRALRYGLATFTRGGGEALQGEGFSEGLSGFVSQIAQRAGTIRRAIAQRRFHLDYQPIVSLTDRSVHHFEALLRPERGLLGREEGTQDFVTLAETVGLTEELDLAVAEMAIAASGGLSGGQRIAVNISGLSMQSAGFLPQLMAILDAQPDARRRLMVELTESAEIEDEGAAASAIDALRKAGVPVCLDDFGAGAAAFRYLKAFRVDFVKVDGAFVQAALRSERDRSFVAAMVDLSAAVGAKVVAERIETEDAARIMLELGVHFGQGWLFGKAGPLPKPLTVVASKRQGAQESWG